MTAETDSDETSVGVRDSRRDFAAALVVFGITLAALTGVVWPILDSPPLR